MANKDIRNLLAQIVRHQATQGPLPNQIQSTAISQAILSAPMVEPYSTDPAVREDIRGPSPLNRILDVISRPLYAVANPVKEEVEHIRSTNPQSFSDIIGAATSPEGPSIGQQIGAASRGFAGKDKTTGRDILEAAGPSDPSLGKGLAGFALDVGLDPLTYTGFGTAPSILGRGIKKSIQALRGVEESSGTAARSVTEEISRRAAEEANKIPPSVPTGRPPAPTIPVTRTGSQVQEPPRTFAAGPGPGVPSSSTPAIGPGPLGRAQRVGTPQLEMPKPKLPENFTPLDSNAISFIKQSVNKGVPLEQAALRPLLPVERQVLEQGIQSKSSRALERELQEATGRGPTRLFGAPSVAKELNEEELSRVTQLEEQRNHLLSRIDDLEAQTTGTASVESIANEIRQLETRLEVVGPEVRALRESIRNADRFGGKEFGGSPEFKGELVSQYERLNNEREQLLQRLSALTEEGQEAAAIGPSGVTRTIINSEINRLETEARTLGREIDQIRRPSIPEPPVQAEVSAGDTIATPTPKPTPEAIAEAAKTPKGLIEEVSGMGLNWRRMMQRQLSSIPEGADRLTVIAMLEAQKAATRSPVFKNMIDMQIRKLREGVTPASLVDKAATKPIEFPKKNIGRARTQEAEKIAESFLKTNKNEDINHIGQTNLFNRLLSWSKKLPKKAQGPTTYQMLRIAEDKILASGRKLVDAEGNSVRLSDIATLAGGAKALTGKLVDDFRHARPVQAVEDAKATASTAVADEVLDPVIQTASNIAESAKSTGLPPSRTVQLGNDLTRELANIAKQAGASSREAGTAKRFMEDFFNPSRDDLYNEVMQEARGLVRQSMTGNVDAHLTDRISNSIYKALQGNPKVLGKTIPQHRVVEGIMTRFATWWNAKDLRPFAREYIDTARNVAAAFERALTPLVRSTTPTQRANAWRVAQGKVSPGNAQETQLANKFQYLVENLLGGHDLSNSKAIAESVLIRSGTTMKELNRELPKSLQFIDSRNIDDLGRQYDYTDGKWMHSWKEWETDNPAEALYQLTRSLQLVTRKNAMLDDAAARWGLPTKGGDFNTPVKIDRLQNFYFPKEIAQQLSTVWNRLEKDRFYYGGKFLQMTDKVQRMWKTGVTIYSPSHHIRNLNGDIFLSALDGVVTPGPYLKSMKVMHAFKGRYKDVENVMNIMDSDLRNIALTAKPGSHVVTTAAGHKLTAEQVYQAAESQGFLLRAATLEDIIDGGEAIGQKFAPFGGRVHQTAAKTSELRDHFVRIAHFIDVLQKSKATHLRDAIEEAGRRVKRFHPDGSDLTGFEQSVMRRVIPFYSWLRKSTPLLIEGLVMRPHISVAFPKAMANVQAMTGVESQGPGDPFPVDQMFPDWIKEKGIGPIFSPDHPMAGIGRQQTWRGDTPGYTIVNPTNPLTDMLSEMTDPKQALMSNLTPYGRIPGELLTGHTSLGIPISEVEGKTPGYLAQQIPAVGIGARITGMTRPDEPYHPEQLTNFLTSLGVQGTGPYQAQAQFELREAISRMGREERERRK